MITDCNVKTITEIEGDKILISCLSAENQNGVDRPTLFRADILENPKTINTESGVEGELMLTHTDSSSNVGSLSNDGSLTLRLEDDDADKYFIDEDGQLKYNSDGQ
jgi:hypothetical protein